MDNLKKEIWIPSITTRGMLDTAVDPNMTGMQSNAKKMIRQSLERYTPPSLPDDIDTKLEQIIHA